MKGFGYCWDIKLVGGVTMVQQTNNGCKVATHYCCYTWTPYGSCIQHKRIFSSHIELFVVDLLEALEAMAQDNQPIPLRAMIFSRKYRTLVSSWIELLQEEAELGHEIDYMARYIGEGGLTGERKRWVPRRGKTPLDPNADGLYILTLYCKGRAYCLFNIGGQQMQPRRVT